MAKRLFDIMFSYLGIIVFFPLFIIVPVLIKIDSKGPVFYRPWRVGKNGNKFRVLKFRTMVEDAEKKGGHSTAFEDERLTKTGIILRRYKIDELPQLFNILLGQMSVVGPRPQVEEYTSQYKGEQKLILSVKPGLTDYASIEFINLDKILGNVDVDKKYKEEIEPRKNELRLKYVKEKSFLVDLKIIFQTFLKLLNIRKLWK